MDAQSSGVTALIPTTAVAPSAEALRLLLEDSRSEETRRAYERDLRDFFRVTTGAEPTPAAVDALFHLDAGQLALSLNGYKANMRERGLAESTVNRRLAALRSLLRMGRRLGAPVPDPTGLVTGEKVRAYRDTRGPELATARLLLAHPDRTTLRGKRDYAILLLLCENALRRGELVKCNLADFDADGRRLHILGKGHGAQKVPVTLDATTIDALNDYLDARRARAELAPTDPLFANAARWSDGNERLTGRGLLHVVSTIGLAVTGKPLRVHALRHMAITAALDATGGDVRRVQKLSRHANIATLTRYDDNRSDLQGQVTGLLASLLTEGL